MDNCQAVVATWLNTRRLAPQRMGSGMKRVFATIAFTAIDGVRGGTGCAEQSRQAAGEVTARKASSTPLKSYGLTSSVAPGSSLR